MRIRYGLVFWLFVLSAVAFLDRTNISIAGLQIGHEFHLSNQRLGWIFSAFLIGYAGLQVPAGWLAGRFGPRRVLFLSVLWWGFVTATTTLLPIGWAYALPALLLLRFALGAGEAAMYPAASQFVARWMPASERGIANGIIFAGVGAGSGLTPPLLAFIIAHHGWRGAFWFSAAVGVVAGTVWWFIARDTPEQYPSLSEQERREIREGLARSPQQTPATNAVVWGEIFRSVDLLLLGAAYFCFCYVAWIFFSWFFLYMTQVRHVNTKSSAIFTMLPFLSMTLFCLLGGAASDWLSRRVGLRVGRCVLPCVASVIAAAFLLIGATAHDPRSAGICLSLGAGALYISQSAFWAVSVEIAGLRSGVYASVVNMSGQIGGAVTASLTPWIADRFGWISSFGVAALLCLTAALCWLFVRPERRLFGQPKFSARPLEMPETFTTSINRKAAERFDLIPKANKPVHGPRAVDDSALL